MALHVLDAHDAQGFWAGGGEFGGVPTPEEFHDYFPNLSGDAWGTLNIPDYTGSGVLPETCCFASFAGILNSQGDVVRVTSDLLHEGQDDFGFQICDTMVDMQGKNSAEQVIIPELNINLDRSILVLNSLKDEKQRFSYGTEKNELFYGIPEEAKNPYIAMNTRPKNVSCNADAVFAIRDKLSAVLEDHPGSIISDHVPVLRRVGAGRAVVSCNASFMKSDADNFAWTRQEMDDDVKTEDLKRLSFETDVFRLPLTGFVPSESLLVLGSMECSLHGCTSHESLAVPPMNRRLCSVEAPHDFDIFIGPILRHTKNDFATFMNDRLSANLQKKDKFDLAEAFELAQREDPTIVVALEEYLNERAEQVVERTSEYCNQHNIEWCLQKDTSECYVKVKCDSGDRIPQLIEQIGHESFRCVELRSDAAVSLEAYIQDPYQNIIVYGLSAYRDAMIQNSFKTFAERLLATELGSGRPAPVFGVQEANEKYSKRIRRHLSETTPYHMVWTKTGPEGSAILIPDDVFWKSEWLERADEDGVWKSVEQDGDTDLWSVCGVPGRAWSAAQVKLKGQSSEPTLLINLHAPNPFTDVMTKATDGSDVAFRYDNVKAVQEYFNAVLSNGRRPSANVVWGLLGDAYRACRSSCVIMGDLNDTRFVFLNQYLNKIKTLAGISSEAVHRDQLIRMNDTIRQRAENLKMLEEHANRLTIDFNFPDDCTIADLRHNIEAEKTAIDLFHEFTLRDINSDVIKQ